MKIITLNIKNYGEEMLTLALKSIEDNDAEIIILNDVSEENFCKIKIELKENRYSYYKNEGIDSTLILSKIMFAVVSSEVSNCCEIYLPGSDTSVLSFNRRKEIDVMDLKQSAKGYKNCIKSNDVILISDFSKNGWYNIYDYPDIDTYVS